MSCDINCERKRGRLYPFRSPRPLYNTHVRAYSAAGINIIIMTDQQQPSDGKKTHQGQRRPFFFQRRKQEQKPSQPSFTPEKFAEKQIKEQTSRDNKHFVAWGEIHEKKNRPHLSPEIEKKVDEKLRSMYSKITGYDPKSTSGFYSQEWNPLRVIPIGGLEEVGGNSMVVEYENDLILIDCGVLFGNSSLPGIDYVIPDIAYAIQNKHRLRAIVITHGHLDHIGALSHALPKLGYPPIYAPKFAIGLMEKQLQEAGLKNLVQPKIHRYEAGDSISLGKITVEPFRVDHSLPDSFGLYIQTPVANIVHTGDFRMNKTKYEAGDQLYKELEKIGNRGVDLLMADSTNALVPGFVTPEEEITKNLEEIIRNCKGRVFVATFSTLVARVQSLIEIAKKTNRKVYLNGRSMLNNTILARDLGYIQYTEGDVKKVSKNIANVPDDQIIVVTTGSQGETHAGLTRIAFGSHPHLALKEGDTVIHSARIIPENTGDVLPVINTMVRKGAHVMFKLNTKVALHCSGHAYQGDIALMMKLLRPKQVMPLHGELFMRKAHVEFAISEGIQEKNAHLVENGDALEISKGEVRIIGNALSLNDIVVEKGVEGLMNDSVIEERNKMKESGVIVAILKVHKSNRRLLASPKIITRGFTFRYLAEELSRDFSRIVKEEYEKLLSGMETQKKQKDLVAKLRIKLTRFIMTKYEKTPIILPIFIEQ